MKNYASDSGDIHVHQEQCLVWGFIAANLQHVGNFQTIATNFGEQCT